ncbi:MAG TPA: ABC transporter permease subunit [Candidatus Kapabacteria bacterium]|nr:ABC transporter permease subunit [Candidatus Kapabacteria bacterium]
MKLFAIIKDTFRELLVRKVLIGFFIFNVLGLAGIATFISSDAISTGIAAAQKKGLPPETFAVLARIIESSVAGFFYLLLVFISVFATASIIPNAMEKGTIDLYLSKPVARWELLFGKILGSVAVIAANIGMFMLGAWIILSLRLGFWNPGFMSAAAVMLFAFVVLYSVVVVLNIVTRSAALGIIVVYIHFLALSPILAGRAGIFAFIQNDLVHKIIDWVYYILPQTAEHIGIASALIKNIDVASWLPIWASSIFAAAMFGLAGWMFQKKDF